MPAIDWPGTSSWKTCSVSGCAAKILLTWREYIWRCCKVALGAATDWVMTTPWSSVGASSVLALANRK